MDKKIILAAIFVFFMAIAAQVDASGCRLVSGTSYYSDGVSNFRDASCRQEIMASNTSDDDDDIIASTGSTGGNCRYNSSRMQYTDGVSFFTDNKCANEAINGATASIATTASVQTSASAGAVSTQISQRIDALEKKVNVLMSLISQMLALLAKR